MIWAEEQMAKQRARSFCCLGSTMATGHNYLAISGIDSVVTPKPGITAKDCWAISKPGTLLGGGERRDFNRQIWVIICSYKNRKGEVGENRTVGAWRLGCISDDGDTKNPTLSVSGLSSSFKERNVGKDVKKNRVQHPKCKGVIPKVFVNVQKGKEGVK